MPERCWICSGESVYDPSAFRSEVDSAPDPDLKRERVCADQSSQGLHGALRVGGRHVNIQSVEIAIRWEKPCVLSRGAIVSAFDFSDQPTAVQLAASKFSFSWPTFTRIE